MNANATIGVALRLAGVVGIVAIAGCDAPNARPVQSPPSAVAGAAGAAAVVVVVVDDDEGEPQTWLAGERPAPIPRVEYVKMSEWTPPPSVQELEATVPPRGDVAPDYIEFPKLTKHSGIGASTYTRRR
jgi:hypothetical protein